MDLEHGNSADYEGGQPIALEIDEYQDSSPYVSLDDAQEFLPEAAAVLSGETVPAIPEQTMDSWADQAGPHRDEYGNYWWTDDNGDSFPIAVSIVDMSDDEQDSEDSSNEYEMGEDGRLRSGTLSDSEENQTDSSSADTVTYTEVEVLMQINDNIVGSLSVVSALLTAILGFLMGREILRIWLT